MIEFILYTTFAHSNMCNEELSNTQDMQLSGDAPSISSGPQPSTRRRRRRRRRRRPNVSHSALGPA
ncbi:hypothetical protein NC653_030988 [Populus alba x Populus x berolinensis]|uniref:Uncharacterized protein n=1 Tax=Populus alba x Populus x berolinensis TaxID=444605 RepID=A0AAD6LYG8_9ROSI|nr:hypothetical protein NC653_030988 [Populus alba x Populus x berolinensis]